MIVCLLQELVFSKVKSYVLNRYTYICEYCSIDHVCLYELRNVSSTMSTFMKPNNKSVNILMFYFWLRTVILASTRVYCLQKATISSFHRNILSVFYGVYRVHVLYNTISYCVWQLTIRGRNTTSIFK